MQIGQRALPQHTKLRLLHPKLHGLHWGTLASTQVYKFKMQGSTFSWRECGPRGIFHERATIRFHDCTSVVYIFAYYTAVETALRKPRVVTENAISTINAERT